MKFVLVLNCGSSSVKFAVIDPQTEENILSGIVQNIGSEDANLKWRYQDEAKQEKALRNINYPDALNAILRLIREQYKLTDKIFAIGHRVVHGNEWFAESVLIDEKVLAAIRACCHLAPLHNPANIAGIDAAKAAFPELPQIAVFDTAFHQTMPNYAYIYPIPYQFYTKHSVRRYGFHGTSHKYVTQKAAKILNLNLENSALISAHLGNGCSVTAVLNGQSIDTSMGLTPLEGLMMGTRSGDVDPGLHAYLADNLGLDVHKITNILNKESGFLGITEKYSDLRAVEDAIARGEKNSILAGEIFCYRLAKYIGALAVPLGRIDALLFTGGIGENSDFVRAKTLGWLKIFGAKLDHDRNRLHGKKSGGIITSNESALCALVVATNEELLIAEDTYKIVKDTISS